MGTWVLYSQQITALPWHRAVRLGRIQYCRSSSVLVFASKTLVCAAFVNTTSRPRIPGLALSAKRSFTAVEYRLARQQIAIFRRNVLHRACLRTPHTYSHIHMHSTHITPFWNVIRVACGSALKGFENTTSTTERGPGSANGGKERESSRGECTV